MSQKLKHNLKLFLNNPLRAYYYIQGHLNFWMYSKAIFQALKSWGPQVINSNAPVHLQKVLIDASVAIDPSFSKKEKVIVKRYMHHMIDCLPCFKDGGCVHCGCSVDAVFCSSFKCKSRGTIESNMEGENSQFGDSPAGHQANS